MAKVPKIIPVSDLRARAADIINSVKESPDPTVITQRGRASAVLLGLEAYEKAEREREILIQLAKGEKEIASGEGYDIDEVFAEADELLDE